MATMHFLSGDIPNKLGNGHFVHVPYDTFQCSDGYIIIAVITDNFWMALMEVVDAPELNTDENKGQPGRWKNQIEINRRINQIFSTNTKTYWLEKLQAKRIPCAPVNDISQALRDPQVLSRNMVVDVEHPLGGKAKMPGNPVKLSDTYEDTYSPPPTLGQHNEEVYASLGMTAEDMQALQDSGVI
jgi:crotonobetainyl-CoA:carnitine CoA-transferase CaiB-like acyl-CoA transferase